jgi:hypothetical protein
MRRDAGWREIRSNKSTSVQYCELHDAEEMSVPTTINRQESREQRFSNPQTIHLAWTQNEMERFSNQEGWSTRARCYLSMA